MKKVLFTAATAAIILSSCSKNEIITNQTEGKPMVFGTYFTQGTKATSETAFANNDVFKVDVLYTGTNDFNAAVAPAELPVVYSGMDELFVTTDGTNWTYDPLKYWPVAGEKLSFFANTIADAEGNSGVAVLPEITNTGNVVSFEYTNPTTAAAQKDLMAASVVNRTSADGTVNLAFNHLLSQINFTFVTGGTYSATIAITSVTIDYADDFYADATFTFSPTVASRVDLAVGTTTAQADETITSTQTVTATAAAYDALQPIMVIPQDKAFNVTVNYTVAEVDGSNPVAQSFTTAASITPVDGFEASTIYTYPVTISLNAIVFGTPTITGWTPAAGGDIDIE